MSVGTFQNTLGTNCCKPGGSEDLRYSDGTEMRSWGKNGQLHGSKNVSLCVLFLLLPSPGVDHHPPLEALQETGGLLALQDLDLPIETHDRVVSHGPVLRSYR